MGKLVPSFSVELKRCVKLMEEGVMSNMAPNLI